MRRPARRALLAGLAAALGTGACRGSLSPLSNKIAVGTDPYVVFVADGEDGLGDLFASGTGGGVAYQITFTRVDERAPALSPEGTVVAFLRTRAPGDTTDLGLVFFNLLNGAERRIAVPAGIGKPGIAEPALLAWSRSGDAVFLRTAEGVLRAPAPPAAPVLQPVADPALADSAFQVPLGDPPAGRVIACADGPGLCARVEDRSTALASEGSAPVRWSGDSVGYVVNGELVVRPLGGGQTRVVRLTGVSHPREWTWFGGGARPGTGAAR